MRKKLNIEIIGENIFTEKRIEKNQFEMNVTTLAKGIYFLRVDQGDERSVHKILIY